MNPSNNNQPPFSAYETPHQTRQPGLRSPNQHGGAIHPVAVVKVLSPVGVEYVFLTLTLLIAASALISTLLVIINGGLSFTALSFPTAALLVSVPVFAALFLRLKKLELRDPNLRLDPSKRRSTQVTQIISFFVSLCALIGFVYTVFASLGGHTGVSVGKATLDTMAVVAVAGGILAYYWYDEHKVRP